MIDSEGDMSFTCICWL